MIVDRIGGRRTAIVSDVLSLVTVLTLVVALFADFVPLWLIVVTQVLGVLFDGPGMVARDALVPRVAREDDVPLVRATSLQETLQNTAQFVGPLAAGFLTAAVEEQGTLLAAAAMFAVAMALIAGLERQQLTHDQPLTAARALADVREGFRFIANEPLLGPLTFLLVAWVTIYVPLNILIFPAWFNFARAGASTLGIFLGAQALGAVLGGLVFAAVAPGSRSSGGSSPPRWRAPPGWRRCWPPSPGRWRPSPCRSRSGWSGPGPCRSSTPPTTRAPPRSCWAGSTAPRSRWS